MGQVGLEIIGRAQAIRLPLSTLCREAGIDRTTLYDMRPPPRGRGADPHVQTRDDLIRVLRKYEIATLRHLLARYDPTDALSEDARR